MAEVFGFTTDRMLAIENNSIVDGNIVGDNLVLTKHGGSTVVAGNVRGPQGLAGTNGTNGADGADGSTGDTGPTGPAGPLIPGVINLFAGSTPPTGTLLCDGSSVSRTTYAALFAAIGVVYGSVDGNTFNLPNLKGRVPVGRDSTQSAFNVLGETAGTIDETLDISQIPSHNHTGSTGSTSVPASVGIDASTTNPAAGSVTINRSSSPDAIATAITDSAHRHGISAEGGGLPHNNLQPYIVLNYIINI